MRVESIEVRNFRGVDYAQIASLSASSVITISGRNGVGKSLLLEAIAIIWGHRIPQAAKLVGPWGNEAYVGVSFEFTPEEQEALREFRSMQGNQVSGETYSTATISATINRSGNVRWDRQAEWTEILWNPTFQQQNPFASVDLLPADRAIPRGERASIDPTLLGDEQTKKFRDSVTNSIAAATRQQVQLTGVQPFLASLDYWELIADREGIEAPDDFHTITSSFEESTGKRITKPQSDRIHGSVIKVETSAGVSHHVNDLSSGEQEVLGLMYFVRRLSARGGILLIDEPELHLHPALQRSLFAIIEGVADRAQIWISTHSPKLVTTADLDSILHVKPPTGDASNQIERASGAESIAVLLDDLGIHPVDLLQNDIAVIVEGPSDAEFLQYLFPVELGRAAIYEAGSAGAVERTIQTLATAPEALPFVGVRDRDLLNDEQVLEVQARHPNLFVWPRRSFENHLLDQDLISKTFERVGGSRSPEDVWGDLKALADDQREEVFREVLINELNSKVELDKPNRTGTPVNDIDNQLAAQMARFEKQRAKLPKIHNSLRDELEARWDNEWPVLVSGKKLLRMYLKDTPFKTNDGFLRALAATCGDHSNLVPPAFEELRSQIIGRLQRSAGLDESVNHMRSEADD